MSTPQDLYDRNVKMVEAQQERDRKRLGVEMLHYREAKYLIYRYGYDRRFWNPRNTLWTTLEQIWRDLDGRSVNIKLLQERMLQREQDVLRYHVNHHQMMQLWGKR